jgi:hypothetical protein
LLHCKTKKVFYVTLSLSVFKRQAQQIYTEKTFTKCSKGANTRKEYLMSLIHYKFTKLYSKFLMLYKKRKEIWLKLLSFPLYFFLCFYFLLQRRLPVFLVFLSLQQLSNVNRVEIVRIVYCQRMTWSLQFAKMAIVWESLVP